MAAAAAPASDVRIYIRESTQPAERRPKWRMFRLIISVDVYFHARNEYIKRSSCRGYFDWKTEFIDATSPETLNPWLRRAFLENEEFVPFPLDSCWWAEERNQPIRVSGSVEIARKICEFVAGVNGRVHNRILRTVEASLDITNWVEVADEPEYLQRWMNWYNNQRRQYPGFDIAYIRAVARPPQEAANWPALEAARSSTGGGAGRGRGGDYREEEDDCCSDCLEDFCGGGVDRLPCRHRLHEGGVGRWLRRNCVCPLCRHQLPAVDDG